MVTTTWLPQAAVSVYREKSGSFDRPQLSKNVLDERTQISADAVQFGFSVYEGIRAYLVGDQYIVFRSRDHHERLMRSCAALAMPCPSYETFIQAISLIIERNHAATTGTHLYIRPIVFATSGGLMPLQSDSFTYAALCTPLDVPNGTITLLVERDSPRTFPYFSSVKTAANYSSSAILTRNAQKQGYDSLLWVNWRGYVQECSTMNIFFCLRDRLVTPPLGDILPGVTRKTMIELLQAQGVYVEERDLHIGEIVESMANGTMTYCFTTSTALGISRVSRIAHRDGQGDITGKCPDSVRTATDTYRLVTTEFPHGLAAWPFLEERSHIGSLQGWRARTGEVG